MPIWRRLVVLLRGRGCEVCSLWATPLCGSSFPMRFEIMVAALLVQMVLIAVTGRSIDRRIRSCHPEIVERLGPFRRLPTGVVDHFRHMFSWWKFLVFEHHSVGDTRLSRLAILWVLQVFVLFGSWSWMTELVRAAAA